jgi:hypothetical protein
MCDHLESLELSRNLKFLDTRARFATSHRGVYEPTMYFNLIYSLQVPP